MINKECNGCEYKCTLSNLTICTLGSPCPNQRDTLMTNEEWFCVLSTEEKADFLCNVCFENETILRKFKSELVDWLKQSHKEEK